MAVKINSISFLNEFRPESTDWLLANIGEKITAQIDFTVSNYALASTGQPIILNNVDGYIGSGWATGTGGIFAEFNIGDTIRFGNYVTSVFFQQYTIIDKLSDDEIRVNDYFKDQFNVPIANNYESGQTYLTVISDITALSLKFGLIENNEQPNFLSKIDGSTQEFIIKEIDATDLTAYSMSAKGSKSWQLGEATAAGNGLNTGTIYEFSFLIEHTFYITPFFLSAQWADLLALQAPDYFNDVNCLKYLYEINAFYEYSNPNRYYFTTQSEVLGNTGWLNENFNNEPSDYFIDSVIFKDNTAAVIPTAELTTNETTLEIIIKNNSGPFSNNNTKFSLNFVKAPEDQTEYISNGKTVIQNFYFDRAINTVGSAAINGDNYGGNYQVLKDVSATFTSASEIKIIAKIALSSLIVSELSALNTQRFLIWVTTQNHTLATQDADKVSLYVEANDFYINTSDQGLINFENLYLKHFESDVLTEGETTLDSAFEEDEVLAYTKFYIDKNGRLTDSIALKSLTVKVKAKNTNTLDEFTLDSQNIDLSGLSFINGAQYVDLSINRVYQLPAADLRKQIKLKRRSDLDGVNTYFYELYFPFLVRWEYWKTLAGVNGDFFDTLEPKNGFNNFWYRFNSLVDWFIFYEVEAKVDKNGDLLSYVYENQITVNDYNSSFDWEPESIKAYDNETNALLYDGVSQNFILGYKETRIEAEFTNNTNPVTSVADVAGVLRIESFEEGGIEGSRRISSVYNVGAESWFKSVDNSNKVKLNLSGNTVKLEALIDFNKIPLDREAFKVTARLYDKRFLSGKLFQDGNPFLFMDGNNYIFEDQ